MLNRRWFNRVKYGYLLSKQHAKIEKLLIKQLFIYSLVINWVLIWLRAG